jgi:hypothetical protein
MNDSQTSLGKPADAHVEYGAVSLPEERTHNVVNGIDQGAELERNFGFMDALGLAFSMLNTWTAMAAALPVGLALGGSATMVWGLLVSLVGQVVIAVTM